MKLYEIAKDYLSFMEAVENGEIPEEAIADTLEAIEGEIEIKADNIACILKSLEAEATALKAEETKLAERRKAKERTYDRLKTYLADTLQAIGLYKMESARNKISFRKSETVEVADGFIEWAQENRDDLLTYAQPKANLTAIKKLLKDGEEVAGAQLITKQNIQIK